MKPPKKTLLAGAVRFSASVAILSMLSSSPFAAPANGGTGNGAGNSTSGGLSGKLFTEINNQIVAIQSDISSLQATVESILSRVTTLEERADKIDQALIYLESERQRISNSLDSVIAQVTQNGLDIQTLFNRLNEVENNLEDTMNLAGDHSLEIAALKEQLTQAEADIAAIDPQLLKLRQDLGTVNNQVTNLNQEMTTVKSILAMKQNYVSGCPAGQFIRDVRDDGTVVCGVDATTLGVGTLDVVSVNKHIVNTSGWYQDKCERWVGWCLDWVDEFHDGSPGGWEETVACPAGYKPTGYAYGLYGGELSFRSVDIRPANGLVAFWVDNNNSRVVTDALDLRAACAKVVE